MENLHLLRKVFVGFDEDDTNSTRDVPNEAELVEHGERDIESRQ